MADVVAITAGTGTNISTDERTINSVAQHIQRTTEVGASAIANGQVAPTNSAATLLAARETRRSMTFLNTGTVTVWVGIATVTTANGFQLDPGASLTIESTALVQAITAAGTGEVSYIEVYDS